MNYFPSPPPLLKDSTVLTPKRRPSQERTWTGIFRCVIGADFPSGSLNKRDLFSSRTASGEGLSEQIWCPCAVRRNELEGYSHSQPPQMWFLTRVSCVRAWHRDGAYLNTQNGVAPQIRTRRRFLLPVVTFLQKQLTYYSSLSLSSGCFSLCHIILRTQWMKSIQIQSNVGFLKAF